MERRPGMPWNQRPTSVESATGTKIDTKAATVTVTFDAERTTVSAVAVAITEAGFPAKVRTNGG